jgi:hypothetical protein
VRLAPTNVGDYREIVAADGHPEKVHFLVPRRLRLWRSCSSTLNASPIGRCWGKTIQGVTIVSPRMLAEELVKRGWL